MRRHTAEVPSGERDAASPAAAESRAALHRSWLLRRTMAAGDWLALMTALIATTLLTADLRVDTLFWAAVFSPSWILVVKLHGLYDRDHRRIRHSTLDELPNLISAAAIYALVLHGLLSLSPTGSVAASSIILLGVLLVGCSFMVRAVVRFWWHGRMPTALGVVVGSPESAAMIARRLETHPEARLKVVGYLTSAGQEPLAASEPASGLPHLGSVADVHNVIQDQSIDRIVIAGDGITSLETEWLIGECKAAGLGLTVLPHNFALFGPTVELNRLAELPVLDFQFSPPSRSTMLLKRAMDISFSAVALILSLPVLVVAALAIKLDSPGPVFFRQQRIGKDGKPFTIIKLRTMVVDAEQRLPELVDLGDLDQPAFKIRNDPRVTRVGRFLRRTSLDEIPQLWNVLRGGMSLVGPRPEEEAVVALYDERQRVRLSVKPGLTGPMQVAGRARLTFEERLALDRDYLDNISITGDLIILLKTPAAILRGDGAF